MKTPLRAAPAPTVRAALGRLAMGLILGLQAHAEQHPELELEALPALVAERARLGAATRVALLPGAWQSLAQPVLGQDVDAFTYGHQVMEAANRHLHAQGGVAAMRDVATLALHLAQAAGMAPADLLTALRFPQRAVAV